jgi:hypothetical protein
MQKHTPRTTRKASALTLIASLFIVALLFVGVTASTDALAGTGYRKGDGTAPIVVSRIELPLDLDLPVPPLPQPFR